MKTRNFLLALVAILTFGLVAQAQVPGVNSTLNSVFTLAYDNSTMKQTFSSSSLFTVASAATDVCTLTGSATKNVRVRRAIITGSATSVATEPVEVFKRSTANSAGTAITGAVVPYDSSNSAGTAVARVYTANPTVGTAVGVLAIQYLTYANNTTGVGAPTTFVFGELGQPIVLRGVAQVFAVNLAGLTVSGAQLGCTIEWTEE